MAGMGTTLILIACLALASKTSATKKQSENEELLMRLNSLKRDKTCTGATGKCFNTAHCCRGLICATFDEDISDKPEVPGNCVKSKDLPSCTADRLSCREGSECVALGRAGQFYCINHHQQHKGNDDEDVNREKSQKNADGRDLGGLGASCETSSDCSSTTEDGSMKLCCQQVRRGRQGIKRLCDRITTISSCINEP